MPPRFAVPIFAIATAFSLHAATFQPLGRVSLSVASLAPVPGQSGRLYLADSTAGKRDCGQIQILENKRVRAIFSFTGYNGKSPFSLATVRKSVFGITSEGGLHNAGTLFRIRERGVQILVQFDETTGAPQSLQVDGHALYGVCDKGVFILRGHQFSFFPLSLANSAVMLHGVLYAVRNYYSNLYLLGPEGAMIVRTDWPDSILRGKGSVLGVTSYGGRYNYGSVDIYSPATNSTRTLVDLQSYNGGHPTLFAVAKTGTLYIGNSEGLWKVGPRPKKLRGFDNLRVLATDGRHLYGVFNIFKPTAFRIDAR